MIRKLSQVYADVSSVTKPILHSKYLLYPTCLGGTSSENKNWTLDVNNESAVEMKTNDSEKNSLEEKVPHLINQAELNDLIIDLQLSKSKAELLGFRLQ